MADILIRGIDVPESCLKCVMTYSFFRNLHCNKLEGMSGFVGPLPHANDRHPDCPLLPLPEGHGRLGDLDALMNNIGDVPYKGAVRRVLMSAPTIVPAEGGGEDGNA